MGVADYSETAKEDEEEEKEEKEKEYLKNRLRIAEIYIDK